MFFSYFCTPKNNDTVTKAGENEEDDRVRGKFWVKETSYLKERSRSSVGRAQHF
jgi:hypothetical protein